MTSLPVTPKTAHDRHHHRVKVTMADGTETVLDHGHVVIASIVLHEHLNPSVMMAAAILAKRC